MIGISLPSYVSGQGIVTVDCYLFIVQCSAVMYQYITQPVNLPPGKLITCCSPDFVKVSSTQVLSLSFNRAVPILYKINDIVLLYLELSGVYSMCMHKWTVIYSTHNKNPHCKVSGHVPYSHPTGHTYLVM